MAILHPSGTTPVTNELLQILHNGLSTTLANSNRSLGCTLSGPGLFVVLRLSSSFLISSVVKSSSLECCEYSTLAKVGISSTFSFVKTLVKKSANTSAFSASLLAVICYIVQLRYCWFRFSFRKLTYFQKFLQFVLADSATSRSFSFPSFLVNFFTLFLALQYSL